jgi:hypothetical protein
MRVALDKLALRRSAQPGNVIPLAKPTLPVFISYSWDSELHKAWALSFAVRLRADGIDARIDEIHRELGDRNPEFMETSVSQSRYVLVICTDIYKRKFDRREGGAGYEGHIISAEMVSTQGKKKFIPILRQGDWTTAMPTALAGIHGVDLRQESPAEYQKLKNHLLARRDAPPVWTGPEVHHESVPIDVKQQYTNLLGDILRLPAEDMPLMKEKRVDHLVVWIRNDALDPMSECSLTLANLQKYHEAKKDFRRNPFTPVVLLRPATINADNNSVEAIVLARSNPPNHRTLAIHNQESAEAGIWWFRFSVGADGKRRNEELFVAWEPGQSPAFVADPRLNAA